jgi:hypothetical protein
MLIVGVDYYLHFQILTMREFEGQVEKPEKKVNLN